MKSRHFLLLASSALLAIGAIQTPAHARADRGFVVAANDKDKDNDAQKKKQDDRRPDGKEQQQKTNQQRQQQQKQQADEQRQQQQKANEQRQQQQRQQADERRQQQQKQQADERRQQQQKANEQRQQQQKQADERRQQQQKADQQRQQQQKAQERSAPQRQATPQRDQKESEKRDERARPDQKPSAQSRPERKDEPKSLAPAATKKDDNAPAARKPDADKKQDAEKRDAIRKLDEQRKTDADKKLDEQKKRDAVQKLDEQRKRDAVQKLDEQRGRDSDRRRGADRDRDSDRKRDADRDRDSDRRRDADRNQRDDRSRGAIAPAAAPPAPTKPQSAAEFIRRDGAKPTVTIDEVRKNRRETREGDRVVIREGDRTIIKNDNRTIIQHVEAQRFAVGARDVRVDRRRNGETFTVFERPNGVSIVNVTDENGYLIRRVRRDRGGQEFVIIDNSWHRQRRPDVEVFVDLPPVRIRDRAHYYIDAGRASPAEIYGVFTAPPVVQIDERYTVDQVRYSYPLRERMPRVELAIHFETGSWQLTPDQIDRLQVIADGLNRAIDRNPREVFLIEGHTDAVGTPEDNLSLSDRRAEAVAVALTEQFHVPPENLVTQGYGEEHLKVDTEGPSRENRRVAVLRITPLIEQAQNAPR